MDVLLFTTLMRAAQQCVSDFNSQELANTAWAFATVGQSDALLSTALARAAERRVGDFNAQELANTVWALALSVGCQIVATVGQSDVQLFMVLARAAGWHVVDFNTQDLVNTAWAFAKVRQSVPQALAIAAEQRLYDFTAQDLANAAWAFEVAGIRRPELMQQFGTAASLLIEQFDPENLINFLWAYEEQCGNDKSWAKAVASQCMRKYAFPSISLEVAFSVQVPAPVIILMQAKDGTHMSGALHGRFRSGIS